MSNFKITKNTDSIDIQAHCLGMDATRDTFPRDVYDHIHRNRGLHIQIRHNKDAQTFDQAVALTNLISSAPEMLKASEQLLYRLEVCLQDLFESGGPSFDADAEINSLKAAIVKAKGGVK